MEGIDSHPSTSDLAYAESVVLSVAVVVAVLPAKGIFAPVTSMAALLSSENANHYRYLYPGW